MDGYKPNRTQEQRILDLLRERGEQGVMSWEIPDKLKILQYNARVFGLRRKGFVIENKDEVFRLISEPSPEQQTLI